MAESQRVLSGSLTRGSRASLSGSVQYFTQGINASTFTSYLGSLIPRVGSGDRTQLYRNNKKISSTIFDDTTTLNNELSDMGGENDDAFEERISFSYEKRNFGQHTEMPLGEPFADLIDFDPVTYLNDNNSFMWPVNLWNLGSLTDHEFDGIIEPLDIRSEILGELDTKYQGRAIRGAVVGSFSNRPWGSIEIKDSWKANESHGFAFLDAPTTMSSSAGFTTTVIYETPNYLTASFTTTGGYNYTEQSGLALELWGELDSTPDDRSSRNVTMAAYGTLNTHYNITSENVGGDKTKSVWNWKASANTGVQPAPTGVPAVDFGAPSYWDTKIGLAAAYIPSTGSYISPGISEFTVGMWVKLTTAQLSETNTYTLMSMGQGTFVDSQRPSFTLEFSNQDPADGDARPNLQSKRPRITLISADPSNSKQPAGQNTNSNWVTQTWNQWHDNEWHHIAATVTVVQGNLVANSAAVNRSYVQFYIDGVAVNTLNSYTSWGAYGAKNQFTLKDSFTSGVTTKTGKCRMFHDHIGGDVHKGAAAVPAIWSSILTADEIRAVYEIQKNKQIQETLYDHHNVPKNEIKAISLQGYQNIESPSGNSFEDKDHHKEVFITLTAHNGSDMQDALRLLNSSSCNTIADPNVKRSSRGFYFGEDAGSITFGDSFMIGELK